MLTRLIDNFSGTGSLLPHVSDNNIHYSNIWGADNIFLDGSGGIYSTQNNGITNFYATSGNNVIFPATVTYQAQTLGWVSGNSIGVGFCDPAHNGYSITFDPINTPNSLSGQLRLRNWQLNVNFGITASQYLPINSKFFISLTANISGNGVYFNYLAQTGGVTVWSGTASHTSSPYTGINQFAYMTLNQQAATPNSGYHVYTVLGMDHSPGIPFIGPCRGLGYGGLGTSLIGSCLIKG